MRRECHRLLISRRVGEDALVHDTQPEGDPLVLIIAPQNLRDRNRAKTGRRAFVRLSIVRAVVIAHDATLTANARPQGGLSIEIHFPLIPFAVPRWAGAGRLGWPASGRRTRR